MLQNWVPEVSDLFHCFLTSMLTFRNVGRLSWVVYLSGGNRAWIREIRVTVLCKQTHRSPHHQMSQNHVMEKR
jgi:hypothetical protein